MMRMILALVALAAAGVAHAETSNERMARCAAQSEIVTQALEIRARGRNENRAIRQITRARADLDAPYTEAISPLVGWIFSLNAAELEADVAGEFRAACEGYKP